MAADFLERLYLSPQEAADKLGFTEKHIRDLCRAGDPKWAGAYQSGPGGRWRIPRNCEALRDTAEVPRHEQTGPKPNPAVRELRRLALELLQKVEELEG